MAKIEGNRVKNFKTLKDVTLGKMWDTPDAEPLTPMTVVIGKNGVGKSTLFDVFGFLADSLKFGVEGACDLRGGFEKIHSQEKEGAIEFLLTYKANDVSLPFTYEVSVNKDDTGRPFVQSEILYQFSDTDVIFLLSFACGVGYLFKNEFGKTKISHSDSNDEVVKKDITIDSLLSHINKMSSNQISSRESALDTILEIDVPDEDKAVLCLLSDNRKLSIATLGSLKQNPEIASFREFIESWYLSYFNPAVTRITISNTGAQPDLNSKGDNLANVVQFMEREHRDKFQNILNRIAEKIPGICSIKTYRDPISNQLHLLFQDKGFEKPFYLPQMSDGTLKVFAYLLLLEGPKPPPFICIEEPENGLYHKLLETLAAEFRSHATGKDGGSQLFITTHQPYFVDALDPEEVWILEKGEDGFATVRRASDDELVKDMVAEGLPLGGLWYSDYLDAR